MVESCLGPGNEARPTLSHYTYCKQLKLEWRPRNEAISKFYSLVVASLSSLFPSLAPRVWEAGDMGGWGHGRLGTWEAGVWEAGVWEAGVWEAGNVRGVGTRLLCIRTMFSKQ